MLGASKQIEQRELAGSRPRGWLRRHRLVVAVLALLVVVLLLGHLGYLLFGHAAVAAAYRGESSFSALNDAIEGREVYSLERYLLEADLQSARVFGHAWRAVLWLGVLLLLFSAARPWRGRKLAVLAAVGVAAFVGALISTRLRFEADAFERAIERRLEQNEALVERSRLGGAALQRLADHPSNGYSFLVDEHLDQLEVAEASTRSAPELRPSAPVLAYEFEREGELVPQPGGEAPVQQGVLRWRSRPTAALASAEETALPISELGRLEVRMRVRQGRKARFFLVTNAVSDAPARRRPILIDLVPGSEFQVYSVDLRGLRRHSRPREVVDRIELAAPDGGDDTVELDYLRIFRDRQEYESVPVGAGWETIAGEARRVLHAWTGLRLSVAVELPAEPVYLSLGAAVLDPGEPVRFTVEAITGSSVERVLAEDVAQDDGWKDATVDLSRYAGSRVELAFTATGNDANVAFWSHPVVWSKPPRPMHVVILLEDALRADRLSGYGYSRPTSPARDRFAATGAVFEHAFSQETKTRPSVPSLMTSLFPTATGVWFFSDVLDEGYTTLAEVMRRQGFATASFVQNPNAGIYAGLHQGFDSIQDNRTLGSRADDVFLGRLDRWLETWSGRNTFLYLHVIDPHGPYDPPAPFDHWYRAAPAGDDDVPELLEMDPEWMERPTAAGRRNLYDGEILYNDERFGDLLELLSAREMLDDTLFVLLSDHGERLGEDDVWGHQPPGFVEGIHVPLFMVHPGSIPPGQRITAPVQLIDVMPTILDLAGIDARELVMQGDSLAPLLRGDRTEEWTDRVVVSEEVIDRERDEEGPWGSVFFRDWQLITSKSFSGPMAALLRRAPDWLPEIGLGTRTFRYTERAAKRSSYGSFHADWALLRSARRALVTMQRQNREIRAAFASGEAKPIELDPEVQDRLRALGYLK